MAPKISNPLTVIAMFSGLAEVFAVIALINVPPEIQQIFVFFVMAFPTLIVLLFFTILNWNHTVLYTPSDYEDEAKFFDSIKLRDALKSEIYESIAENANKDGVRSPQQLQMEVSEKVDKVIQEVNLSSRKEQILALLNDGSYSVTQIAKELSLNRSYAYRLLSELAEAGKIVQERKAGSVQWMLAKNDPTNA